MLLRILSLIEQCVSGHDIFRSRHSVDSCSSVAVTAASVLGWAEDSVGEYLKYYFKYMNSIS